MKNILVPIDFSKVSENALNYAIDLANSTKSRLTLMHVYVSPIYVGNTLDLLPSPEKMEKEFILAMEELRQNILQKNKHLEISIYCTPGMVPEQVEKYAETHEIDLIIIGTQGRNYLEERMLGSTASSMIRTSAFPIMTIDRNVHFRAPGKILLATDFKELESTTILKPLKELAALFSSHLYILNVVEENTINSSPAEIAAGFGLNHTLKQFHHTFFYSRNEDIVKGINEFTEQHKMDMVVMIPHHHSFISRLFIEPQTHKMAFHSKVPLLTLH